jgi:hypothetical protein
MHVELFWYIFLTVYVTVFKFAISESSGELGLVACLRGTEIN